MLEDAFLDLNLEPSGSHLTEKNQLWPASRAWSQLESEETRKNQIDLSWLEENWVNLIPFNETIYDGDDALEDF